MVVVEERGAAAHFLEQELLVDGLPETFTAREQSGRRRDVGEHDGARSSIPAMERRLGSSAAGAAVVRRRLSTRRAATTQ